jgi:HK97 family phage prohead protease
MLHKSSPFEFKSLDDAGTFEALVAVFNNVDKGGDRIRPGAFKKTLKAWKDSGDPIPVIFNHDWGSPDAHIGVVEDASETSDGLLVKGRLDVADNPVARQVHRLMSRRSLKEFSFGYSVPAGGETRGKDGVNDLSEIELAEVGPTLKGMNPATELHAVKSAVQTAVTDALAQQVKALEARLGTVEKALEGKADETGKETAKAARSVDPLRQQAEAVALEFASDGLSLRKPPRTVEQPAREPEVPLGDLKRRMRDELLMHLSGEIL